LKRGALASSIALMPQYVCVGTNDDDLLAIRTVASEAASPRLPTAVLAHMPPHRRHLSDLPLEARGDLPSAGTTAQAGFHTGVAIRLSHLALVIPEGGRNRSGLSVCEHPDARVTSVDEEVVGPSPLVRRRPA
jgi:hypothetical protein